MSVKSEISKGHIYYFEPNDLEIGKDQLNGDVPLMPHFEDLCISIRLEADIFPREKSCNYALDNSGDSSNVVKRSMSWISYVNQTDGGVNGQSQQIVNSGVNFGSENYLTTYYTEIGPDKYIENEMVEGLGVTNINISFESWYTPTITINFVDVHGSSLWGREEAIHDNGEINANNVLGVFFTQPYPLFRLQIKGFLGHDVTYQLTCSSFKGKYNSQTGNFEATATFIGYNYGLLTDIPVRILSVVSEMTYEGRKYWDSKVNSPEWQMINADGSRTPPPKLYVLIDNIRSAIGSMNSEPSKDCNGIETSSKNANSSGDVKDAVGENRIVSNTSAANVTNATAVIGDIANVKTKLKEFIQAIATFTENERGGKLIIGNSESKNSGVEHQLVLLMNYGGNQEKFSPIDIVRETYVNFNNAVEEYNERNNDNKFVNVLKQINPDNFHNDALKAKKGELSMSCKKIFQQLGNMASVYNNIKISDFKISDSIPLFENSVAQLDNLLNQFNSDVKAPMKPLKFGDGFGDHATIIPLGNMYSQIDSILKKVQNVGINTEVKIETEIAKQSNSTEDVKSNSQDGGQSESDDVKNKKIIEIIGFEPTIGNFVKMLMCHLETFIEVMMHCSDKIYIDREKRTCDNLGVPSLEYTDISDSNATGATTEGKDKKWIFPWPALYRPQAISNSETSGNEGDNSANVLGWTNDYPPKENSGAKWEEQDVILSVMEAIQRYSETTKSKLSPLANYYSFIPMTGADIGQPNPFSNVGYTCTDIQHLTPYLGLRIAQTIGVGDNKCTQDIAEAIGYMDALNLIESEPNSERIKDSIVSKETNQDFVTQVIDYLTCSNKVKQTSETERGNTYNLFETLKPNSGNKYSNDRHPMFVKDGEKYKYSYTYKNIGGEKAISIIPSELRNFNGNNNPYAKLLTPNFMDEVTFIPKINLKENGSPCNQYWIYNCDSKNIIKEDVDIYTNEQMFNVLTDTRSITNLLKQINALKEGSIKFNQYKVNGETEDNTLKKFVNRRYKVSLKEYNSKYNGSKKYRMLIPLISNVDNEYASKHLLLNDNNELDIKFDNQWCIDVNSDVYKNTTIKIEESGKSFKDNGGLSYDITNVQFAELPIMTNSNVRGSLFSSQLYYQQNDIIDEKSRNRAKGYLLLSSLMSGLDDVEKDIFKSDDTSLIKLIAPYYVLFIGALLWRKSLDASEDINFGEFAHPDKNTTLISKKEKIMYIDTNYNMDWYTLEDYYLPFDSIDIVVKNRLIYLFKSFCNSNDFKTIIDNCELKNADGSIINGAYWISLRSKWSDNDFDEKNPEEWKKIFGNFKEKYSSITLPSSGKSILRLLISEGNKCNSVLKRIYGIDNPYIISRATTQRIGFGDIEVSVSESQMKGYLRGFERRIKDLKVESASENSEEHGPSLTNVDRDIAVSLYYTLKNLWDSWLITSTRDQFTIQNFFNRYFIFMDSFYVNTYNTIKLNAQTILDAYDSNDPNLFTYITNVVSPAGCMTFALPSFIDSNVMDSGGTKVKDYISAGDMSWKKENLQKMFTPIPYNEMGSPQLYNVFVFIYVHPYSSSASESNDKRFDSYMMNNEQTWPSVLSKEVITTSASADRQFDETNETIQAHPNNTLSNESEEMISSRYAYRMPCFGVAVNRGNNYIFKSINVNMDSPKITAVSAQTLENILVKSGNDSSKRINFHGQDIFSIYSQYSYACEVEMLGCAQIQPLMYFQLLNMPMWGGTYMIYKVTHSMSPGTMTTKFTGMKMSGNQSPFATGYYTTPKKPSQAALNNDIKKDVDGSISGNGTNGSVSACDSDSMGVFGKNDSSTSQSVTENMDATVPNSALYQSFIGGYPMLQAIFGEDIRNKYRITGKFGEPRGQNKKTGLEHYHKGIDIACPDGTPLYAPWDGYVKIAVTNSETAGNFIQFVDNQNQNAVAYLHCQNLNCTQNKKYKSGDLLAWSGHTGKNSTNGAFVPPHLHLELFIKGNLRRGENGDYVDPLGIDRQISY